MWSCKSLENFASKSVAIESKRVKMKVSISVTSQLMATGMVVFKETTVMM